MCISNFAVEVASVLPLAPLPPLPRLGAAAALSRARDSTSCSAKITIRPATAVPAAPWYSEGLRIMVAMARGFARPPQGDLQRPNERDDAVVICREVRMSVKRATCLYATSRHMFGAKLPSDLQLFTRSYKVYRTRAEAVERGVTVRDSLRCVAMSWAGFRSPAHKRIDSLGAHMWNNKDLLSTPLSIHGAKAAVVHSFLPFL